MGVAVSSPVQISAFSLISGIIGYIGFTFTIGTFLKVVWINVETVSEASTEIHEYLTTLRQELLEEKRSIKMMRQRCRRRERWRQQHSDVVDSGLGSFRGLELDDVALKTTNDVIKRLIKQFKDIERPFLADGEDGIQGEKRHNKRRNSSASPYYEHSAYASPSKDDMRASSNRRGRGATNDRHDSEDDEDRYWVQRVKYANLTMGRRIHWINAKPKAQGLFDRLTKVQIRRMSQQMAGLALLAHDHGNITLDIEERMRRVDDRIGRIVGVR
jgi:hypothetical protein